MRRHLLVGLGGSVSLLVLYLGLITWAQDLSHALKQTAELWYWVLALAAGFGTQVGLFSFVRQGIRRRRLANTGSVAASGGVSATSMAACCAHHLSDILPIMGLSGAAIFLVRYQLVFIIAGVLSNIIGIIIMLETIQRHSLSPWLARWRWNLGWVKKGAMALAVLIVALTFLVAS